MNSTIKMSPFNSAVPKHNGSSLSLGIRGRLFVGFAAIGLVLLISISVVLIKVTIAEHFAEHVISNELPTHDASYDLSGQIYSSQSSLQNFLISRDAKFKTEFDFAWSNIARLQTTLDDLSKDWDGMYIKNWHDVNALLGQLKVLEEKFSNSTSAASSLTMAAAETSPIINQILNILDGPVTASGERVGGMFDLQYQQLQNGTQEIISDLNMVRTIEYILLVVSFIASFIIAYYTARGVMKYVNVFRDHSNRVAAGDLTQRITLQSNDEMGQLGEDLNIMTESLASITKKITDVSHNMVTTLEEVKHSVDVQSSGASEQASSINQITASLEEIEKSSAQTLDKTKSLGEAAERTREKGQLGLEAVEQSVGGMKAVRDKVQVIAQTILDLSNKTQQVGEITAVVNRLAQQSKMLALNASIEAAKAGEAGKGFAVVAEEVKNLAEQSEQSTAQVQKILEDIRHATEKAVMATEEGTKGVDHGTALVEQTGDIVRSLTDVIHETTVATQQIEAAVRQESIGIEQITAGMNEINQVTSSFVQSVQQTTEAIENLSSITKNLKEHVDVYRT